MFCCSHSKISLAITRLSPQTLSSKASEQHQDVVNLTVCIQDNDAFPISFTYSDFRFSQPPTLGRRSFYFADVELTNHTPIGSGMAKSVYSAPLQAKNHWQNHGRTGGSPLFLQRRDAQRQGVGSVKHPPPFQAFSFNVNLIILGHVKKDGTQWCSNNGEK